MKAYRYLLLIVLIFLFALAKAEVRLPKIFSSNMVLQQGIEIPVWGWAETGEQVVVTLNNTTVHAVTDKNRKWTVKLPGQKYGGPFVLTVKGKNTIILNNVMIGEVWVCSGQSNMEWPLAQVKNAEKEIAGANYPKIRLFTVPKKVAQFPEEDVASGEWVECSPETVPGFSAVGFLFGRSLHDKLDVPVGLIHSSWGGTVAETWTSPQTIQNDPDFRESMIELQQMNMEEYRQNKEAQIRKILGGELPTEDKGMKDGKPVWSAPDLNDKDWKTIQSPGLWENQGYLDIDGIAWYRKELDLTDEQTQSNLSLHLGKIDDSDITFLNGIEIGETDNQYDKDRIYTIDKKYLKPGKNMIVVRVDDTGGGGGMWGEPEDQFVAIGKEKIDISGNWKFKISKAVLQTVDIGPNTYPTLLYNGMINPIVPYGIKGAIWYQGESNEDRAFQYRRVFKNLITDWRTHWGQGDFPFLFVSLANFHDAQTEPRDSRWAELREAQTMALDLPNTGMAMAIDIGDAGNIHPRNKQDVGNRLALNAFKVAYHHDVVNSGPMFQSVEFKDGKAYITFKETGAGLAVKDKYGYVKAFTLAGADNKFHWAKAEIISKNTVEVSCDAVPDPIAVRFGWADNPDDLNLYNVEGLPAVPFRSDDWPGITR